MAGMESHTPEPGRLASQSNSPVAEMGCGLNKFEKRDEKRPGNIYSTLKRPQVETKIDVSYEYRFLEFTTLNNAELPRSSAARLSSWRDLPAQLQELYQQGFALAALHPFVQPTNEREKTPQEQIFRAVLIKKTERSQKTDYHNEGYILELECCSSLDHLAGQKIIPDFIKKIQDAASRGLKFVGVIPHYSSQVKTTDGGVVTIPGNNSVETRDEENGSGLCEDRASLGNGNSGATHSLPLGDPPALRDADTQRHPETSEEQREKGPAAEQLSLPSGVGDGEEFQDKSLSVSQDLRKTPDKREGDMSGMCAEPLAGKLELFTIFNKPKSQQKCRQYYTVSIPLRVSKNGQTVSSLDANWLEHMSDHFRKGGVLVNAVFYLGMVNDSFHGLTDGVFIFEDVSTEESKTIQGYDAIVVEQWTVLEGVEVQTDYIPLLNSLAAYGWQLTCVLPTPIVTTNREGNLATKQIVFLQRPSLPQKAKKKESKFQWRFSREDMHSRQAKKSKAKLSTREKQQAEENEKNLEDQSSKLGYVGNRPPNSHEVDGIFSKKAEAPEEMDTALQEQKARGETQHRGAEITGDDMPSCPESRAGSPSGDQVSREGSCTVIVSSGEESRAQGSPEADPEPPVLEEN
ncbi:raftlin isoform X2 [Ornithorhynchus anatinus]|nr:raftlin isoform X2 [Ornithorhynchus anatinus]